MKTITKQVLYNMYIKNHMNVRTIEWLKTVPQERVRALLNQYHIPMRKPGDKWRKEGKSDSSRFESKK